MCVYVTAFVCVQGGACVCVYVWCDIHMCVCVSVSGVTDTDQHVCMNIYVICKRLTHKESEEDRKEKVKCMNV